MRVNVDENCIVISCLLVRRDESFGSSQWTCSMQAHPLCMCATKRATCKMNEMHVILHIIRISGILAPAHKCSTYSNMDNWIKETIWIHILNRTQHALVHMFTLRARVDSVAEPVQSSINEMSILPLNTTWPRRIMPATNTDNCQLKQSQHVHYVMCMAFGCRNTCLYRLGLGSFSMFATQTWQMVNGIMDPLDRSASGAEDAVENTAKKSGRIIWRWIKGWRRVGGGGWREREREK